MSPASSAAATCAQRTREAALGLTPRLPVLLLLEVDSDNHGGSIVRVVLTVLSPAVAHIVRLPEVPSATRAPVAALVMMVVVPLLLALHAHVRHDHLRAVPHAHRIPSVVTTSGGDLTVRG